MNWRTRPLAVDVAALPADAPVLVGFSGGLDSTVLLHLLAQALAHGRLRALHVHHGLHPSADAWAAHCAQACAELGIPLDTARVAVPGGLGLGPEAAAREARHRAFAAALRPGEVLALAHHRDDQAETFLLRALRGSGPDGLAAMRAWRAFAGGWLWRPLLDWPRPALLAHARGQALHWVEDDSNADARFDRNYLRQRVLPLLRERWGDAGAALARSATLQQEATDLLDAGDARTLREVQCATSAGRPADPALLPVGALVALPAARRARVLRRWVLALGLPPLPAQGVARIEQDLLAARADSGARFDWAGACVRRWRGWLRAGPARPPLPPGWRVPWRGEAPLRLPGGGQLQLHGATAFDAPMVVHARQGGERIRLPGRAHSHALKHLLQEHAVPPWERERLPLLSDAAGQLLAAADVVSSGAFADWLHARGACLRWTREGPGEDMGRPRD